MSWVNENLGSALPLGEHGIVASPQCVFIWPKRGGYQHSEPHYVKRAKSKGMKMT